MIDVYFLQLTYKTFSVAGRTVSTVVECLLLAVFRLSPLLLLDLLPNARNNEIHFFHTYISGVWSPVYLYIINIFTYIGIWEVNIHKVFQHGRRNSEEKADGKTNERNGNHNRQRQKPNSTCKENSVTRRKQAYHHTALFRNKVLA